MKTKTITLTQKEVEFVQTLFGRLGDEIDKELIEIAIDENGDVDEEKLEWGKEVLSKLY